MEFKLPFPGKANRGGPPAEVRSFPPADLASIQLTRGSTWHSGSGARYAAKNTYALTNTGFCQNVIANRCVRLIAESSSSIHFTIHHKGDILTDHPVKKLLEQPNLDDSKITFLQKIYGFLQTSGNAYLKVIEIGQEIKALYCLRPDRIKIISDRNSGVLRYEYSIGTRKEVFSNDPYGDQNFLIHIKQFNPLCDYYGFSPLEVAYPSIKLHNSATSWNKSLLENSARPSGALVYQPKDGGENLTTEQFERLKSEMSHTFQGKWNVGRPMILEGGLDWKQMSLTPADMDFLDAKHSAARDIALAFGVPPMLLGIPGDNTYTNYKEANIAFWRQTIIPLVENLTTTLSRYLLKDGEHLTFDRSFIEKMTPEYNQNIQRILDAEFITDSEKRLSLGFPAISDKDQERN